MFIMMFYLLYLQYPINPLVVAHSWGFAEIILSQI